MLSLLALSFWLDGDTQGLSRSYQDLNTHAECILGRYAWPNESIFLSLNSTRGETTDEPFSLSRHHERSLYIFLFLVRVKIEWVAKHVLVCHVSSIRCFSYWYLLYYMRPYFAIKEGIWGATRFSRTFCKPCCLNVRHNHIEFHGMWSSTPTLMKCSHLKGRFDILLTSWSYYVNLLLLWQSCSLKYVCMQLSFNSKAFMGCND